MRDEVTFNKIIDKVHHAKTLLRFTKELINIKCSYPPSSDSYLYINGLIDGYNKVIDINLVDYLLHLETYLGNIDGVYNTHLAWKLTRSNIEYNQDIFIHWRKILLDKNKNISHWSEKSFVKELLSIIDDVCPQNEDEQECEEVN